MSLSSAQHRAVTNGHSNTVRCASLECCAITPAMSIINFPRSSGTLFTTPDGRIVDNTRWSETWLKIAIFAARWYASAAYIVMRCLSVCVCVCPSRSWIVSKRVIESPKCFSPLGSQAILVFPQQTPWQYSDGNRSPPNGDVECRWGRRLKSRFSTNIWLCDR